jgi:hypothetical protein
MSWSPAIEKLSPFCSTCRHEFLSVHLCPLRRRRICQGGTIVIASGAEHRRLSIPKLNRFA